MQQFALTTAVFEGSLVLVAMVLGWALGVRPLETFRFDAIDALLGVAATLPLLGLFWLCLKCPFRPFQAITKILDETVTPLFRDCQLVHFAILAALAGVGEETLFRGVLQAAAAAEIGGTQGVWGGLLISAALFGLLHCITPTYTILAGLIGLYLGGLWIVNGNLLTPIIAHGLYDFVALVYLVRRPASQRGVS